MMRLQLFSYHCRKCNEVFQAPRLGVSSYGEFLLRSKNNGVLAFLNALSDPVYDEVSDLLAEISDLKTKGQLELADTLQSVFGVCCDPDIDGNKYMIGLDPVCPSCRSQDISYWEEIEPAQFIEVEIPSVTHSNWLALSKTEKITLLKNNLK